MKHFFVKEFRINLQIFISSFTTFLLLYHAVSGGMKGREHHQGKGFVKPNFTCHVHPITNIQIFIIFLLHDVRIDFKDVDTCLTPPLKT